MFAKGGSAKQSCTSGMVGGHGWGFLFAFMVWSFLQGRIVCQERRDLAKASRHHYSTFLVTFLEAGNVHAPWISHVSCSYISRSIVKAHYGSGIAVSALSILLTTLGIAATISPILKTRKPRHRNWAAELTWGHTARRAELGFKPRQSSATAWMF